MKAVKWSLLLLLLLNLKIFSLNRQSFSSLLSYSYSDNLMKICVSFYVNDTGCACVTVEEKERHKEALVAS